MPVHRIISRSTGKRTDESKYGDPFKEMKAAEKLPGFARGDWLINNFGAKLKCITPYIGEDIPAAIVQQRVCEPLLMRDLDTLEFVPVLATGWDISPDGLTINMHLRKGVTFSDGEPFTADDVVFTFDWIKNEAGQRAAAAQRRRQARQLEEEGRLRSRVQVLRALL